MEKKGPLITLQKFFGNKPGQDIKGFSAEIKELGDDEKRELAELAAHELGVEVDWSKMIKKTS